MSLEETKLLRRINLFHVITGTSESASNYFGKFLGSLKSYHHGLGGDVYVVDSRTIHIRNFNYDGEGPGWDIF